MSVAIDLLGSPTVRIDGHDAPSPRGHKAWALLAYLLLTPRPPTRERMATLLFDEAADPLGALRWNLAQLRRTLGDQVEIGGEPLTVELPPDSVVDVAVIGDSSSATAVEIPGLGHELLEGIDLPARRSRRGCSLSVGDSRASARPSCARQLRRGLPAVIPRRPLDSRRASSPSRTSTRRHMRC